MTPDPRISVPLPSVDPRTICLGIPSKSSPDVLMANGLANIIGTGRLANQPLWKYGGSNVAAVRMTIVHEFLKTQCDWLMMIDDDICFTVLDWDLLWEDQGGELAVCAEYLQKIPNRIVPAQWGLGFARVHRLVFEKLMQLSTDDGQPFVRQGFYCGELMWDFFPQGINAAGEYRQEDHGFWMLVRLAQIPTRYERRTKLGHAGRMVWKYDADEVDSDDGGGQ